MILKITRLTEKDLKETSNLIKQVIGELKYYSNNAKKAWISDYSIKNLKEKIHDKNWILLIAKKDEKIVGFSDALIEGKIARSGWSCIKKEYRTKGTGTSLYIRKEKECLKKGCHKIQTDSRTNNKIGIAFLKSRGFKKEAFLKNHWFKQDYYLWYKFIK